MNFIRVYFENLRKTLEKNSNLALSLALIFIVVIGVASAFADQFNSLLTTYGINTLLNPNVNMNSVLDVFLNNEIAALSTYLLSIFFGIVSIFSVILNGLSLGILYGTTFPQQNFAVFVAYILPHGIFEIPAIILESVAGILLFKFLYFFVKKSFTYRSPSFKEGMVKSWDENKVYLIHSVVLIIFVSILLIIAAIIEVYLTPTIGSYVANLF